MLEKRFIYQTTDGQYEMLGIGNSSRTIYVIANARFNIQASTMKEYSAIRPQSSHRMQLCEWCQWCGAH